MKHVTNLYADVTQSDPVLGIGSLAVEESDSISVFIEKKMNTNIHAVPVNAYPLLTKKPEACPLEQPETDNKAERTLCLGKAEELRIVGGGTALLGESPSLERNVEERDGSGVSVSR